MPTTVTATVILINLILCSAENLQTYIYIAAVCAEHIDDCLEH